MCTASNMSGPKRSGAEVWGFEAPRSLLGEGNPFLRLTGLLYPFDGAPGMAVVNDSGMNHRSQGLEADHQPGAGPVEV